MKPTENEIEAIVNNCAEAIRIQENGSRWQPWEKTSWCEKNTRKLIATAIEKAIYETNKKAKIKRHCKE